MGKTALALNIAEHAAVGSGLAGGDLQHGDVARRSWLQDARLDRPRDQHKLRTGELNDEDWPRDTLGLDGHAPSAPIFIDDGGAPDARPKFASRARRLKRQHSKLGLIVVDYLQLMSPAGSARTARTEISEISRSLKAWRRSSTCR